MVTPQSIQHHSEPQKAEFLQQGELWEPCAAVSKDTGVYFRSARLPGHEELGSECCFEVACEPPAVYTALWESFPGLLSWPELSWSTAQDALAQSALSSMTHGYLACLVSLYFPPYTISIYICPPVFSSHLSAQKT